MALSQIDRITISEKVVDIPQENASVDKIIEQLESGKDKAINKDNANKTLMDEQTSLVNPYQLELTAYDGNQRTELVEQDILDSAKKILQNPFFPNDVQNPTPSLADGVWKNFPPFARSKAVGKNYFEAFPSTVAKEQDKIDAVNNAISAVEAIAHPTRSSGKECVEDASGTCSIMLYTDQVTCEANAGVWTPTTGPDTYITSTTAQDALNDLVAAINDWKSFVLTTKTHNQSENSVDDDATRLSENNTSISDIDNLVSILNTWITLQDFDTTTPLPSGNDGAGCALFDAMVPSDFDPSKLREDEIQPIKDEVLARVSYISTRKSQVEGYLGAVDQNMTDGSLNSESGFYGLRFKIISLRLHLMGGTKNAVEASERGIQAQEQLKDSNDNALDVYGDYLAVTKFKAPAAGTPIIHVDNASQFSVGDTVYVVAKDQEEIQTTVEAKSGNMVTLNSDIPKKYRQNEKARLYKVL